MKPFLMWPTEYGVVTQKWMSRPQFYSQFGLPGHEGLDLRAPRGSKIFSPVDGIVSEIGWRRPKHAYGYATRVQFDLDDGKYEVVLAHGLEDSVYVAKGDVVKRGDTLMLADSTGNSSADHLHITFKKLVVGGKAPKIPKWASPLDYIVLSSGEVLFNPQPWLLSYEESQQILNPKEIQRDFRKVQFY